MQIVQELIVQLGKEDNKMELQEILINHLFNDETKSSIIKALNDKVDIPFINEKTEAKILDAVYC